MDWSAEVAHEERALEVLIGMTAKTLCRRSNIHLEQALLLIEVSLGHANAHWKMLNEQYLARKQASLEAQLKAAKASELAEAAKLLAEAKEQVAAPQDAQTETSTSEPQAMQPAQPAATQAASPTQQQTAELVSQQAGASAAAGAAQSTDQAGQDTAIPEPNQDDNPGPVIQSLPKHLLKHLARLLGQSGLSDLAQKRCACVIKMLVDISSGLKPLMLAELQQELQR